MEGSGVGGGVGGHGYSPLALAIAARASIPIFFSSLRMDCAASADVVFMALFSYSASRYAATGRARYLLLKKLIRLARLAPILILQGIAQHIQGEVGPFMVLVQFSFVILAH